MLPPFNLKLFLYRHVVKKAYHKASLKYHPDRVNEDQKDEATKKFQYLGKIYSILSDKEKRKIYDETGFKLLNKNFFYPSIIYL